MKEKTVYLLYNTNASDVKLHHGLVANFNREIGTREWEYEDKDEFTIMYSSDDLRKYTDIKILSKTKLRERPKSADQQMKKLKVSVEGIFMRRSNSFSTIEEDLIVLRRCPLIKPLLSETEIQKLQQVLKECRWNKQITDKIEASASNGLYQQFPGGNNLREPTGDLIGTHAHGITKDMPSWITPSAFTQESDAHKAKEKAKIVIPVTKNDITDNRKTKYLDKLQKLPTLNPKKLKKDKNKIDKPSSGVNQKVKTKKQDSVRRPKSEDRSKNDKSKHTQSKAKVRPTEEGKKKLRKKSLETQSQTEKKALKNKSKASNEDDHKEKKQKKHIQDSAKTQDETNKTPISKENLSKKDQSHSSEKRQANKQIEPKNKSNDTLESTDHKLMLKKNKDRKRTSSTSIEKTKKPEKPHKNKPAINSDKLTKDEKRQKSSSLLSSKTNVKKGKMDQVKTEYPNEADFHEDLVSKKVDGKSTQPKSSPSDKSKTKNKSEGRENENASAKKGKTKDKLLPGTIQYMIHYILSNPIFIDLGWTLQPTEKAMSRIVTFKAVPANPKSYCFRSRDNVEQRFYPSGALALNIAEDGTGWINYPGGTPAIVMARSNAGMKLTLYSCPSNDPLVKDSFYTRIIGMFDSFGNGVVYDSNGKKLLNFNQMEGVHYNPSKKTPHKWQWSGFKVLEEQRLKWLLEAMLDEEMESASASRGSKPVKAPSKANNEKSVLPLEKKPVDKSYEALLEELPYPVMPKPKKKIKTHDNTFKSIIIRINKEITLRINGQDSVAVNFLANTLYHKMDLGVRIDPEIVERVDKVAQDRVSVPSVLGDILYPSPSLQKLHQLLDPHSLL